MPTKTSTIWVVIRTDWSGESDTVDTFDSEAKANTALANLRSHSKAVDDPRDKIRYAVEEEIWTREA